jgi:hypothetical protein
MREAGMTQPKIDTSRPHAARMYDYFLGGKDHFAADRETADKAMAAIPTARTAARENRAFLGRAVRYLVAGAGIRQFLDIGTGLPSASNVHEVAQSADPACRVAYVDNDPVVLAHAQALLTSAPGGKTAYIQADLRDPEKILADPAVTATVDFSRPVALMLVGILHFVPDADDPARIMNALLGALPPGSYLAASHGSPEYNPEGSAGWVRTYRASGVPFQLRTADEFDELAFTGLELVDPGLVVVSEWRPQPGGGPLPPAAEVGIVGGVARKP